MLEGGDSERLEVDFCSLNFKFAKFDGLGGCERDGEDDLSLSGMGVIRASSVGEGLGEGADMVRMRGTMLSV